MNRVWIVVVLMSLVACADADDRPTVMGRLTDQQISKIVSPPSDTNDVIGVKIDYARQLRDAKCVGASLDTLIEAVRMMYEEQKSDPVEPSLEACPDCHRKPKPHKVKRGNKFVWSYFCGECGLSTDDLGSDGEAKIQWGRIVQEQKSKSVREDGGRS